MSRKFIRTGFFIALSAVVLMLTLGFIFKEGPFEQPDNINNESPTLFIAANPVDLSEISYISPFRSCMGHDYSGKNINGEREINRSMKHYLGIKSGVRAKAFAPFNGEIIDVQSEQFGRDAQVWIQPDAATEFAFIFFHIDITPGLAKGSKVQSGQLIGYSNTQGRGDNFDIGLKKFERFGGPNIFDSPFNYMTAEVLKEYKKESVTLQNIIISKDQRDANACNFGGSSGHNEQLFLK